MRLLINTSTVYKGGACQVALSILQELRHIKGHDYGVILTNNLMTEADVDSFPANFSFYFVNTRPATKYFSALRGNIYNKIEKEFDPDCVFTTSGPAYWRSKKPHLIGYNLAHYIYPDSPYFRSMSCLKRIKWKIKGIGIRYFYRRDADAIVTQTEDVRYRASHYLGIQRSYSVGNTCGSQYDRNCAPTTYLPRKEIGEWRLLCLTAYYGHKNLEIIKSVVKQLRRQCHEYSVKFILTIKDSVYTQVFGDSFKDMVVNIGQIPPMSAPGLYREVDFAFIPTLLECFSASYPEAMEMGTPILTSNLSFARSICGDAALYFDPLNPDEIAEKIFEIIESKYLQQSLVKEGRMQLSRYPDANKRVLDLLEIVQHLDGKK